MLHKDITEGAIAVTQDPFCLQHDIPGEDMTEEWQAIVADQALTLEGVLNRLHDAVAHVCERKDFLQNSPVWFKALIQQAEHFLAKQALMTIKVEQDIAQLQGLFTDPDNPPLEAVQKLSRMEQANAVLHANLAAARRWLTDLLEDTG